MRDYALEFMEQNPYTNIKIDCYGKPNPESETRMFRRIFICLGALKLGFKASQMDFIGWDGT